MKTVKKRGLTIHPISTNTEVIVLRRKPATAI